MTLLPGAAVSARGERGAAQRQRHGCGGGGGGAA